ncbi:MAG: hypothetical protein C4317_07000, partial [Acidimicrobiia bacterium]
MPIPRNISTNCQKLRVESTPQIGIEPAQSSTSVCRRDTRVDRQQRPDTAVDKIRIAVVDDHPIIREGVAELATTWEDVEVVAT